jgi:adenylyl-sulfate kinase
MSVTLWFMGRPAAGKSTLAKQIEGFLRDKDVLVENLDGDEIRQNLHPNLGFTREDRMTNNRRTAFIAKLLNRNDISVVTGMITPFRESQRQAREIVQEEGDFILIYVKCSVGAAAERDPKNLYEKAQNGKIEKFTGINHPFQEPHNPDIVVDTEKQTVEECVETIKSHIHERGLLDDVAEGEYEFDLKQSEEDEIKDRLSEMGHID